MILVDSSVWIDMLRNTSTIAVARLQTALEREEAALGDLIMAEVLQGINERWRFERTLQLFGPYPKVTVSDPTIAVQAARNFRRLRALGITPRKTIDTLIATRCIVDGIQLLYSDRDFDPFVTHLGLRSAL